MSLDYDFDILDLVPDQTGPDPFLNGFLARIGFPRDTSGNKVALFRDLATADALRDAPDGLRDYFLACGFGLNTYHSGAPPRRYPAEDEAMRLEIIDRLSAAAPHYPLPLPGSYAEGGTAFRLGAFLANLELAEPMAQGPAVKPKATVDILFDPAPPGQRRKFWQNRVVMIAAMLAGAVAVLQISASLDVITFASL